MWAHSGLALSQVLTFSTKFIFSVIQGVKPLEALFLDFSNILFIIKHCEVSETDS
jgi:hypothetical protein